MVQFHLQQPTIPQGTLPREQIVSIDQFKLCVIAHQLSALEASDKLLALPLYQDKIKLLPHQTRTALHVLNNFSYRALLADEVGLGKTIEAGMIIKELLSRKLVKKVLILTPATLKFQWQEEMRSKFGEHFEIANTPDIYEDYDLVIASIDTAKTPRHAPKVENIVWDLLVIDEAHKLKNSATLNYKLVKNIKKERCFMLTATPLQNNIFELWAVLDLLHPGFVGTKAKFSEEFVTDKEGLKIKNKDVLQDKLSKIMVRNLRRDTGIKFAERIVKTHLLEFSKEEMDFYNQVLSFIKTQYDEIKQFEKHKDLDEEQDTEDQALLSEEELKQMAVRYRQKGLLTFALIMLTRQITSSLKTGIAALQRYKETLEDEKKIRVLEAILFKAQRIQGDRKCDYLIKLLNKTKDEKAIIFTTFIHTQKMLEMELKLAGFSTVVFNGKMNPQEKEVAINQFKSDKQILICTDAGSEGRNLQFAHVLINYDLPWNPMRVEQRIGRIHRIGQEKDVIIHNLAIMNTVEAYILNRLYEKINLFTLSIGEMDTVLSELKTKGSVEASIFDAVMTEKEDIIEDFTHAAKRVEEIKQFDQEIFDTKTK
ncbi:DEAD/DEAH box helicase family protein [Candidatus Woesearchaeota archaeon]|nr:DEAD/DEAH box helicase family protein [Candidatus Woesearchaeota archaeon]